MPSGSANTYLASAPPAGLMPRTSGCGIPPSVNQSRPCGPYVKSAAMPLMFDSKNFVQLAAVATGLPPTARGSPNAERVRVATTAMAARFGRLAPMTRVISLHPPRTLAIAHGQWADGQGSAIILPNLG